jgi:hypothetical protein
MAWLLIRKPIRSIQIYENSPSSHNSDLPLGCDLNTHGAMLPGQEMVEGGKRDHCRIISGKLR